jgi:hypothetical protein
MTDLDHAPSSFEPFRQQAGEFQVQGADPGSKSGQKAATFFFANPSSILAACSGPRRTQPTLT